MIFGFKKNLLSEGGCLPQSIVDLVIERAIERQRREIRLALARRDLSLLRSERPLCPPAEQSSDSSPVFLPKPNPNATPEAYAKANPFPKGRWT